MLEADTARNATPEAFSKSRVEGLDLVLIVIVFIRDSNRKSKSNSSNSSNGETTVATVKVRDIDEQGIGG